MGGKIVFVKPENPSYGASFVLSVVSFTIMLLCLLYTCFMLYCREPSSPVRRRSSQSNRLTGKNTSELFIMGSSGEKVPLTGNPFPDDHIDSFQRGEERYTRQTFSSSNSSTYI